MTDPNNQRENQEAVRNYNHITRRKFLRFLGNAAIGLVLSLAFTKENRPHKKDLSDLKNPRDIPVPKNPPIIEGYKQWEIPTETAQMNFGGDPKDPKTIQTEFAQFTLKAHEHLTSKNKKDQSPKVAKFIDYQNNLTQEVIAQYQQEWKEWEKWLKVHQETAKIHTVYFTTNGSYFLQTVPGMRKSALMHEQNGQRKTLFAIDDSRFVDQKYTNFSHFTMSRDESLMALSVAVNDDEEKNTIFVIDAKTGKVLKKIEKSTETPEFVADNDLITYHNQEVSGSLKTVLRLHKNLKNQSASEEIIRKVDPDYPYGIYIFESKGNWYETQTGWQDTKIYALQNDLTENNRVPLFEPGEKTNCTMEFAATGDGEHLIYLLTDEKNPFGLVKIVSKKDRDTKELAFDQNRPDDIIIRGTNTRKITGYSLIGQGNETKLVLICKDVVYSNYLKVLDLQGNLLKEMELPKGDYQANTYNQISDDPNKIFLQVSSFNKPYGTVCVDLDEEKILPLVSSQEHSLASQVQIKEEIKFLEPLIPTGFLINGKEVKLPILELSNQNLSSNQPTIIIEGYGGFGINYLSQQIDYKPNRQKWLSNGDKIILVGARGGTEQGPKWQEKGIKQEKMIADIIRAVMYAVEKNPECKIVLKGSSHGGLTSLNTYFSILENPNYHYLLPNIQSIMADVPITTLEDILYLTEISSAWKEEYHRGNQHALQSSPDRMILRIAQKVLKKELVLPDLLPPIHISHFAGDQRISAALSLRMAAIAQNLGQILKIPLYLNIPNNGSHNLSTGPEAIKYDSDWWTMVENLGKES